MDPTLAQCLDQPLLIGEGGGASGAGGTVRTVSYRDARRGRGGVSSSLSWSSWGEVKASFQKQED